jgi:hypothetical protein
VKNFHSTKVSALAVAQYLLSLDPERKYFTKNLGNFRLNTMLHIIQMLYCSKYGKPLFKEVMYAYPPQWYKLKKESQAKLGEIIHHKEIKTKKILI